MISSVLLAGFCEMKLFNAPINMKSQHSPGKPPPPRLHSPRDLNCLRQACSNSHGSRLPWHKWWSNARSLPGGISFDTIGQNHYLDCKEHFKYFFFCQKWWQDLLFFLQEVEIHRNEVKLLEANNAKLEAEIRWMLCQFVFEILFIGCLIAASTVQYIQRVFSKDPLSLMSENKTTYCLK